MNNKLNYPSFGSSGIRMYNKNKVTIKPGEFKALDSGEKLNIYNNLCGIVFLHSLLFEKGLVGHTGVLDSDYKGNIFFYVRNVTNKPVIIDEGDILGQVVVTEIHKLYYVDVKNGKRSGKFNRVVDGDDK